jgi:hypothetical protein
MALKDRLARPSCRGRLHNSRNVRFLHIYITRPEQECEAGRASAGMLRVSSQAKHRSLAVTRWLDFDHLMTVFGR